MLLPKPPANMFKRNVPQWQREQAYYNNIEEEVMTASQKGRTDYEILIILHKQLGSNPSRNSIGVIAIARKVAATPNTLDHWLNILRVKKLVLVFMENNVRKIRFHPLREARVRAAIEAAENTIKDSKKGQGLGKWM